MDLSPTPRPDFVVVGHLTRDAHPDHFSLGGTATFAAITARNLGYRAAILTRAAPDFPQPELLTGIEITCLPSETTTTFRNLYQDGRRRQYVSDVAGLIDAADLPPAWSATPIALLGPVAGEVSPGMVDAFQSGTLLGVVPQGWLRRWGESGRVSTRAWTTAPQILPRVGALVLSEEDLGGFTERLTAYVQLAPIVVLTRGREGCTVYQRGRRPFDSPAFSVREVDPTGAGDVFTAAFLIRLKETGDTAEAARFANCAASFAVEGEGPAAIPTRAMIEERLQTRAGA